MLLWKGNPVQPRVVGYSYSVIHVALVIGLFSSESGQFNDLAKNKSVLWIHFQWLFTLCKGRGDALQVPPVQ